MSVILTHADGVVRVTQLRNGRNRISVEPLNPKVSKCICQTSYPIALIERIINVVGLSYLCYEIRRDEDPRDLQHILKYAILGYVSEDSFDGKRILDFGCGSGSSTAVVARMFPNTDIIGVDFDNDLLSIARLRAEHYEFNNVTFVLSLSGDNLPSELGSFDYVILSAVYEHLLPSERETLLPKVWLHLKPGGIIFINQTYYRYFPIESHTTRLPLINYLSDKVTLQLVRRFSSRVSPDDTWETLLRKGIRGASVKEISHILNTTSQKPIFLEPERLGMKDRIDLWYQLSSDARLWTLRKCFVCCSKILKIVTGRTITPSLSLAIKKSNLEEDCDL